jgi:hypothetical protein
MRSVSFRIGLTGVFAALFFLGAPAPLPAEDGLAGKSTVPFQRGVSWVAGHPIEEANILALVDANVNWIVQTPFGWQREVDTPKIILATGGRILWGETDTGLKETGRLAQAHGIQTLLKPHIWLTNAQGKWRADIAMKSDEDWRAWFRSYRAFILHYARLAEAEGFEALCVGMELTKTVSAREHDWRALIAAVREVYSGKLTYSANWFREFEKIPFWDALDFIGIQGYFPLSSETQPTAAQLRRGWEPHRRTIAALAKRTGKPIVFTEIGYRSTADTAKDPWRWPRRADGDQIDVKLQARCYQVFYEIFWNEPYFAGAYWWKWFPNHNRAGGEKSVGFTPQNKPAEDVLKAWYKKERSNASR